MTKLLTRHIATMTEMREPHKVLERAGGEPVAILRNSALVGYFVPADAVSGGEHSTATDDVVQALIKQRVKANNPVLSFLRDK
jgi:antitoxin StbD